MFEPSTTPTPQEPVRWEAAEFITPKTFGWYATAIVGGVLLVAVVALLTKDIASSVTVFVALIILLLYARRKPRTQTYTIEGDRIEIGTKKYELHTFKSFSVDVRSPQASAVLMPLKRFMPPLAIPLIQEKSEQVVAVLSAYLPFEQHKPDLVDTLVQKIRL